MGKIGKSSKNFSYSEFHLKSSTIELALSSNWYLIKAINKVVIEYRETEIDSDNYSTMPKSAILASNQFYEQYM